jgi:Kef-type K+ transport system membrane component KefB
VEPQLLGLAAVITLIAVATKVVGGYLGAVGLARSGRLTVGVGMVPRGEREAREHRVATGAAPSQGGEI